MCVYLHTSPSSTHISILNIHMPTCVCVCVCALANERRTLVLFVVRPMRTAASTALPAAQSAALSASLFDTVVKSCVQCNKMRTKLFFFFAFFLLFSFFIYIYSAHTHAHTHMHRCTCMHVAHNAQTPVAVAVASTPATKRVRAYTNNKPQQQHFKLELKKVVVEEEECCTFFVHFFFLLLVFFAINPRCPCSMHSAAIHVAMPIILGIFR